jgi:hypothetical protein
VSRSGVELSGREGPVEGGAQVAALGVEDAQPRPGGRSRHIVFGPLAERGEERQVAVTRGLFLARVSELLGAVSLDRLEQPVAVCFVVDLDQGLVDQG